VVVGTTAAAEEATRPKPKEAARIQGVHKILPGMKVTYSFR
jgi:hypothetical protein